LTAVIIAWALATRPLTPQHPAFEPRFGGVFSSAATHSLDPFFVPVAPIPEREGDLLAEREVEVIRWK
jgi:hypothetical protein